MRQATNVLATGWSRSAPPVRGGQKMAKIVYRSRASKALSPKDIHDLTRTAQSRNEREAITGVMVHDYGHFYQWIEGPADNLGRVMHSIRQDERHTDIEILGNETVETRAFDGWSMKLAMPGPVMPSWRREVIEPPPEIVETLRRRPHLASALLVRLRPCENASVEHANEDFAGQCLGEKTARVLKEVFLSTVVPVLRGEAVELAAPHRLQVHPRMRELADLLVSSDQGAAVELIGEIASSGVAIGPLVATVFEPAARHLGDLWSEDLCTEFDVTLGLCRLQSVAGSLASDIGRPARARRPAVLIVPEPGELHRLGAALDGGVLRRAGWSPQCDYPSSDEALQDMVASTWFDVLDLSLSVAFRREHLLGRVSDTIAQARLASCNKDLVVIVGGRVFREIATAGLEVGADLALSTAMGVDRSILNTVDMVRPVTPLRSTQAELCA